MKRQAELSEQKRTAKSAGPNVIRQMVERARSKKPPPKE
jgi:hypothetical protein